MVKGVGDALLFERVGPTKAHLTLTNVVVTSEALGKHGITPEKLAKGGVPLATALDFLERNVEVAKGGKNLRVFFVGANSDSFDMRMMQYTLARRSAGAGDGEVLGWMNLLKRLNVVGTIDTTRLLPSLKIFEGLNGKNGRSVGSMHQLILGRPLEGAHRAGTDVDGVVNILCSARVTHKIMTVHSAIPLDVWLEHSNHSKARMNWETKMKAEVEAEQGPS